MWFTWQQQLMIRILTGPTLFLIHKCYHWQQQMVLLKKFIYSQRFELRLFGPASTWFDWITSRTCLSGKVGNRLLCLDTMEVDLQQIFIKYFEFWFDNEQKMKTMEYRHLAVQVTYPRHVFQPLPYMRQNGIEKIWLDLAFVIVMTTMIVYIRGFNHGPSQSGPYFRVRDLRDFFSYC